jgi:predicted dehydrogenase
MEERTVGKKLCIGVYGVRRGGNLAAYFAEQEDVEITAGCDFSEAARTGFLARFPSARAFDNYDDLLTADFDVLILASFCHEHGPDAVKALQAGKHVFSEVTAFHTLADGVALVEAVEKSDRQYMLAANTCYFRDVVEMERIYREGNLGEFLYGEAEFAQDIRRMMVRLPDGSYHWRCWLPPSYYNTHALAPLLSITGCRPVSVIGQSVESTTPGCLNPIDFSACFVRFDNGGVAKALLSFSSIREPGAVWYSVYGTRGSAESGRMRLQHLTDLHVYEEGDTGAEYGRSYLPRFALRGQGAAKPGAGEGNYFTVKGFLDALRQGSTPPIDIYRACDFTLPGILAYRSAVEGGRSIEIPDFRDPAVRKTYRNDHFRCPRDEAVRRDQEAAPTKV